MSFGDFTITEMLGIVGPLIAVAYVLGGIGQSITRIVFPKGWPLTPGGLKGWRYWFRLTYPLHPMVAGALVGLVFPLPVPEFMGPSVWAKVLWYSVAGLSAIPIHAGIVYKLDGLDGEQGNIND